MSSNIRNFFIWLWKPRDVDLLLAFILFTVTFIPFGFMSAYFFGVIQDNHSLSGRPTSKMLQQANSFIKDIHDNVSGHKLLENYSWLDEFQKFTSSNCNDMSKNLKYLQYTSYLMALYNTVFMHILLYEVLPVSVITCVPTITSLISTFIKPTETFLLGVFHLGQILFTCIIMGIFLVLKEKKLNSQRILNSSLHKFC